MPSKADVKAWKAQLVAQAEQQILKLTDSDRFKQYLNTLAKFHHYSARNIDLIYAQNPQATQVAGFKQWQKAFNRTVKRGAKAIRIAAPIIKKLTPAEKKRLDTTDERAIVGYRYLPVFDVSQTSGEPVLSAKDFVKENLADHKNVTNLYNELKNYLNNNTDIKVSEKRLSELGGAKGYFQPSTNEIVIGGDEPDNALKLKTLYHEYAHSQLHGLKSAFKDRPRAYQETQAEAVAYVAMQNIGVDTSNYSLGYVATWAKDKAVIHSALSEIQQVSNKVIELSDGLTKQLGLQEAQKEPEHDLKKLSAQDLNKSYQGLQQQIQQATNAQSSNLAQIESEGTRASAAYKAIVAIKPAFAADYQQAVTQLYKKSLAIAQIKKLYNDQNLQHPKADLSSSNIDLAINAIENVENQDFAKNVLPWSK